MTNDPVERSARGVIFVGYDTVSAQDSIIRQATEYGLGGVIFFKRNIPDHRTLRTTIDAITAGLPKEARPLMCVDQEGGRVARLGPPLTVLPSARQLGRGDAELTRDAGALLGRELRSVGLDLNFAPVLDVDTRPDSPIIGDRSFGPEPEAVAIHGVAFAEGLLSAGVIPCAKHFPGHGDASLDSHLSLPVIDHERTRLEQVEMAPYRSWIAANCGPIMTAHILFPALDPDSIATASRPIISDQLRQRMGFEGVVFTDDLEMHAVSRWASPEQAAIAAIEAGVDGLLICKNVELQTRIGEALSEHAKRNAEFAKRLAEAATRIEKLKRTDRPVTAIDWIGSDEHLQLQSELNQRLKQLVC